MLGLLDAVGTPRFASAGRTNASAPTLVLQHPNVRCAAAHMKGYILSVARRDRPAYRDVLRAPYRSNGSLQADAQERVGFFAAGCSPNAFAVGSPIQRHQSGPALNSQPPIRTTRQRYQANSRLLFAVLSFRNREHRSIRRQAPVVHLRHIVFDLEHLQAWAMEWIKSEERESILSNHAVQTHIRRSARALMIADPPRLRDLLRSTAGERHPHQRNFKVLVTPVGIKQVKDLTPIGTQPG